MLKKLGECQDGKYEQLPWDHVESAVIEMFVAMAKYTDKKNSSEIWKILIVSFRCFFVYFKINEFNFKMKIFVSVPLAILTHG